MPAEPDKEEKKEKSWIVNILFIILNIMKSKSSFNMKNNSVTAESIEL